MDSEAAVDHASRLWTVQAAEVGPARCYDFVALVVTVVASREVFADSNVAVEQQEHAVGIRAGENQVL